MITSKDNPAIKRIRALQSRSRQRRHERAFIVEGVRLTRELLSSLLVPEQIFFTESAAAHTPQLLELARSRDVKIVLVSDAVMASCTETENPSGVLASAPVPAYPFPKKADFVLIVDQIADPGNMGTLLRTAHAAGVDAVLVTRGSIDPTNPKVVRSAMGAHFHLPIITIIPADIPNMLGGMALRVADSHAGTVFYTLDWTQPCAIVIGSEAHGPSAEILSHITHKVRIPMPGGAESLNAATAGAILLYEIVRQRGLA